MTPAVSVLTHSADEMRSPAGDGTSIASELPFPAYQAIKSSPLLLDTPFANEDVRLTVWLIPNADSSGPVFRPVPVDAEQADSSLASTADQMALAVHTLGFNKRQLAEVFGVSRQAIYDWLKGANVNEKNTRRLAELANLLKDITAETRRPLYHRFTTQSLDDGCPSILDLLLAEHWDRKRIRTQLRRARSLTTERDRRLNRRRRHVTQSDGEENLEDNLAMLGEER